MAKKVADEENFREETRVLRQVLDTLPIGVAVVDSAGDVTLANPASTRVWGGTIVRAVERWPQSKARWHASGREMRREEWPSRRALAQGETTLGTLIDIDTYDGDCKTIQHAAAPIRDADGVITGAVVVNEDVTERVRAEDALRKAEAEVARHARRLERLSRKLIEAQETERRSIARELHDDLGQVLNALKLNLLRRDRCDAESLALVDGALARMRDLAQQLRPPLLDELGLAAALRWYVEREAARADLAYQLSLESSDARPPVTLEAAIFRIAQEALANVIRHAAARMVCVELRQVDGTLELVVLDDGRGFDVAEARRRAANGESLGLINLQERVALAGGDIAIESAFGKGTKIKVRVPLAAGALQGSVTTIESLR
ncbi:MAG TPA: ATP-binding protein [Gemmatimonadaceae bacterium]